MARGRKTLESWIQEALTDEDKEGKCSMIALVHMVGQQQKEIHAVRFGGKTWAAKDLAEMLRGKAETYCQDLPGVQTFQLLAFYNKRSEPEAHMPFVVNNVADSNGMFSEPPTDQGRLQMSMRREEMLLQQVYRRQQVMDDYSLRIIEQQGRQISTLLQENKDAFDIVKEMLMTKALDDHNRKMEQLNFERSTIERKKWLSWVPMLANTILGREVFPQSSADTVLIESIAESLDEESIMKLAGSIKPELMGPLAARMEQYINKKNREEEQLKALHVLKTDDPEGDAAGDVPKLNGKS